MDRRTFFKTTTAAGGVAYLNFIGLSMPALASPISSALCDPSIQPLFTTVTPNALDPAMRYPVTHDTQTVSISQAVQQTGLVNAKGQALSTKIYGYGPTAAKAQWPGWTFEVQSEDGIEVEYLNEIPIGSPILAADTSYHWCYALDGYTGYTMAKNGVPVITHLHGGHVEAKSDGYPEAFYTPNWKIKGPSWQHKHFHYSNNQPAGALFYHDHALGITRLNVHAGMAGFYFVRDKYDTGKSGNPLGLPVYPYEIGLAIQDRMFTSDGSLYYPIVPGTSSMSGMGSGNSDDMPMPEFFGDHMTVNGKIWPKMNVEPRLYRLRLLNGCDSRFLSLAFRVVPGGATSVPAGAPVLPFTMIGADQGLAAHPKTISKLVMETGSRYDLLVDFSSVKSGQRVIVTNAGGDEPYGDGPGEWTFDRTDRVMAFDVTVPRSKVRQASVNLKKIDFGPDVHHKVDRVRKLGLFEGTDCKGRVLPLQGTMEPATDYKGRPIYWPSDAAHKKAGLTGQVQGALGWGDPLTENPKLDDVEEWWIYNTTEDAHSVHLHLVHFEILSRSAIVWDSATTSDDHVLADATKAKGNGLALLPQTLIGHDGMSQSAYRPIGVAKACGKTIAAPDGAFEDGRRDTVIALPGTITRIRTKFDLPGRYVWHCHMLSHEDHDMMRMLHVGKNS